MVATYGFLDVINAEGSTIATAALDVVIQGTSAVAGVVTFWPGGDAGPVTDVATQTILDTILTNQGTVIVNQASALTALAGVNTALAGNLKTIVPPLLYSLSTSGTVTPGGGTLVAAGLVARSLVVTTPLNSTANVWLNVTGGAPVVGAGIPVWAGGGDVAFGDGAQPLPLGPITAITDGTAPVIVALSGG
jgi:hypothetical protein